MAVFDINALGLRIKALRREKQISATQIAKILDVSKQLVSHWEHGRSELTLKNLMRLAEILQCDVAQLLSPNGSQYAPAVQSPQFAVPLLSSEQLKNFKAGSYKLVETQQNCAFTKRRPSPKGVAFYAFDRSMEPAFYCGDLIIVDPDVSPDPGDCIAVWLAKEERMLFRRIRPSSETRPLSTPFTLKPDNPDYEPRIVTDGDAPVIVGTLIEHTRFTQR